MSKKRKLLLIVFIVVSLIGMWVRHANEKQKVRERERLFRTLSMTGERREPTAEEIARAEEARAKYIEEPRRMYDDGTLPQESLNLIGQAIGQEIKAYELAVHEDAMTVTYSPDGQSLQRINRSKSSRTADEPQPWNFFDRGKLTDHLFDMKEADLSLVPKIWAESAARSTLINPKVSFLLFKYDYDRTKGDHPIWWAYVKGEKDGKADSITVLFDWKGNFLRVR